MSAPKRFRTTPARPPWWPEGEPWPPRGRWRLSARQRVVALLGIAGVAFFLLVVCSFLVIGTGSDVAPPLGTEPAQRDGNGGAFLWLVLAGIVIFFVVRYVRGAAEPVGEMMDAAEAISRGDYSVRVHPRGPRSVRRLIGTFNQMTERLAANDDQRRRLLADVAHELRTPLSVIRGNLEGMIDGVYPRDDAQLTPIIDETRQMARLLDDLQTLATAEAGALKLYLEPTDLSELVCDAVAAFAGLAKERGVKLRTVTPEPLEMEIDPVRMRQVLDNLLSNALRWTPAGGEIVGIVDREAGNALITVRDTGPGVKPEHLVHIFERFTKSADSGGSGLGLAIARGIVGSHGGKIAAFSPAAGGLTITIRLPI